MVAGLAQLQLLEQENPYPLLEQRAQRLVDGIVEAAGRYGIGACGNAVGSMFGVYFVDGPVRNFQDALEVDREFFSRYYQACLEGGVFFAPSPFEAGFVSTAHGEADIDATLEVVDAALAKATGRA